MSSQTMPVAHAVPLRNETLADLPEAVTPPRYDRQALTPSVVHFGVGGFHRAHQAVYFDELANLGITDWGMIGIGISRWQMADVLNAQDHLFTVVERSNDESHARVIGAILDFHLLAKDADAVLDRLCDPQIRLVTLTITGDGYTVGDGADVPPDNVFSVLVAALDHRRQTHVPPFTVLSCDNLADSGAAAQRATLSVAQARSPELAEWVRKNVAFPSSMVDRITPSTTPSDRDNIEAEFLVADRWPVTTETFSQWVIEDWFCNDRPPLDQVGARFVEDIKPYKLIKSRMLNGTHCAVGYLGTLSGYARTDEAMTDPVIADYVCRLTAEEIMPLLPADIEGMELSSYRRDMMDRLQNPAIADPLSRLCRRGSTKMRDYLLPSLIQARAEGKPRELLTVALAGWLAYAGSDHLDGQPDEVEDDRREELAGLARCIMDGTLPRECADIFGDLLTDAEVAHDLRLCLESFHEHGVRTTLEELLGRTR
jgi:mannitol 2-dehydrogenase